MGLAVAALGHVMGALHTYGTCKSFHKLLTYTQQTVSISTIEHVYRYATLLLGVRVCLGGVRINNEVSLRVTFVGGCATGGP